ncbi:hypothetical protein AJ79_07769 [Helicocarpus griseus UAMH5409]|uniref:GPI transamidase component PIG-S n=1 Tax=Helicocarpus griseus UAMH5409 TaxID=1447875 RepID=A0A2B7WZU6_9EURO|nr:hypothetical protein AJ79_07769 [Helicocarpus griseus UAMH5409]
MPVDDIVSDPSLLPVLKTSAETLSQCQNLLAMLDPSTLVSPPAQDMVLSISKQQKLVFSLLSHLRGLNRDAIFNVRATKQATAEARQEIDRLHLHLQNLYYEQRHLNGEIAACESYDHKYLSLPLIPVEEFLAIHPELSEADPNELMIARINHEHAEREKLEQARQELLKRKQALIAENKKRKDDLANLDQDLERFIDKSLLRLWMFQPITGQPPQATSRTPQTTPQLQLQHVDSRAIGVSSIDTGHELTMGHNNGAKTDTFTDSSNIPTQIADNPGMTTTSAKRSLPPEKPEAIRTRTLVISAFWAVIIFLGLPMWWQTTSIYRAKLPLEEMKDWADGKACRPVFPLQILVQAPSMNTPDAEHLIRTTQHALDDLNDFSAHHLRLRLVETSQSAGGASETIPILDADVGEKEDAALNVRLLPREGVAAPTSELHAYSERLDIFYPVNQTPSTSTLNSLLASFIAAEVQKLFNEEKATIAYILSQSNTLSPSLQPGGQSPPVNNREQGAAVMKSVAPQLAESITRRTTRSFKYAETYHLSFSLFTPGPLPSSWDIEPALQEYLLPLLRTFSPISNFSIDTQVQVYANFAPTANQPEYDESQDSWTLKKEDLSSFINAAEWPLSPSIGKGPTINFVLYVPSPTQSPLVIKENRATSWLIPQWGGVVILNPPLDNTFNPPSNPPHLPSDSLRLPLSTFSHQLLTLLGTPSFPSSLPLRLQTLVRVHTASLLLSASSTMGSLARLTHSLASIPIPLSVANSVSTTISHLSATCELLREGRFKQALASARVAENEAERSFFEKSMVGQVYFPDEHKVAVYLPLLGPIGVPLVMGLIKEGKRLVLALRARRVG